MKKDILKIALQAEAFVINEMSKELQETRDRNTGLVRQLDELEDMIDVKNYHITSRDIQKYCNTKQCAHENDSDYCRYAKKVKKVTGDETRQKWICGIGVFGCPSFWTDEQIDILDRVLHLEPEDIDADTF